ncbi:MAG: GntR family transcriptional regulator [Vallitalea sp.]|jgi:GntR family transcriptional regulator|nr:GntR family transcriptional regulator [Vallitalea sp.]
MVKVPAYMNVYALLKKKINNNVYEVGEFLPPEKELEKEYDVSRTTIRRAIELLAREGFVLVQQGRGTEVLDVNFSQYLNGVTSISETLRKQGCIVKPRNVCIDVIVPSSSVAKALGVKNTEEVIRIQRVQLADDIPIAIMENYISKQLVPNIEKESYRIISLYKFLESEYGIVLESAVDKIFAKNANFMEAEILQIPYERALICMKRTTYCKNKPITYDYLKIRADKYQLEVNTTVRV